jgi:hypothetical protein
MAAGTADRPGRRGRSTVRPAEAAQAVYFDCDPAVARDAARRLRPQAWAARAVPAGGLPGPAVTYVLARGDTVIDPACSRRAARELLGVTAMELDGGHAPFLSRPSELAEVRERVHS